MAASANKKWLMLIHQIPPKPDALRVKIWRRLQQVGAVAVKPSVYLLPSSDQSREDFSWTLHQVVEGGGDGAVVEARFVDGLGDDQIVALFRRARKADYEKLIQEANGLLSEWSAGQGVRIPAALSRLRRRLEEIKTIDYFQSSERATADLVLKEMADRLAGQTAEMTLPGPSLAALAGRTWVTRRNLFVDRLACGWLIRRFVDPEAKFRFVAGPSHTPGPDETRFDMFDGEFTHEGDNCSFEVMIRRMGLQDPALNAMAEIVHDIDLKDGKFGRAETDGIKALLAGLTAAHGDDDRRMAEAFPLFETLYAYFHHHKK